MTVNTKLSSAKRLEIDNRINEKLLEIEKRNERDLKINIEIARAKNHKVLLHFIANQQATYAHHASYAHARRDVLYAKNELTEDEYEQLVEYSYQWNFNLINERKMENLLLEELVK
jgi:hypothetical protein